MCTLLEYLDYWWYTTGVQYWSTWSSGGTVHVYITGVPGVLVVPGYQKALEHRNSIPRLKGFCEADKVKLSAGLFHNPKCRNFLIIDIFIFYEKIDLY